MALFGLMLVPFYIDRLGVAAYAVLPLATTITSYVLVVSDEISNAFSRYLVIAIHGDDQKEANKVFTTTLIGLGRAAIFIVPVVVLISFISPYAFQIGPSSATSVQIMFLLILLSALLMSFSACFNSIYTAFNKRYIVNTIRIAYLLLQVFMIVGSFLIFGPRLEFIGLAYIVSSAVFFVLMWVTSKKLCPALKMERHLHSKVLLKEMGGVGLWAVLNRVGLLLFIQASLILVNIFLGAEEQTRFAIVATLISMTNTACIIITTVIAPFLYLNFAKGNKINLIKISKTSMRFIGLVIAFPIAYLCVFAPQILTVWVGESFSDMSNVITVMFSVQLAVCVVTVLETIPVLYLRIRSVAMVTLSVGALNIIITAAVLILSGLGTMGAAIVWTLAMLSLNVVLYPLIIAKMTESAWTTFLRPLIPGHIALVICAAVGFAVVQFFALPSTWLAVLGVFFVLYVIYLVIALAIGLKREDKDLIRGGLPEMVTKIIPRWLI